MTLWKLLQYDRKNKQAEYAIKKISKIQQNTKLEIYVNSKIANAFQKTEH